MSRKSSIERSTKETRVSVSLDLDGGGNADIDTTLRFLDHMLETLSRHSGIDIFVRASGDTDIDDHHLVEDIGICIGRALDEALGEKRGIARMAHSIIPMDDARAEVSLDLSSRPYAVIDLPFSEFEQRRVGDVSKENIEHFLESLALNARFNLNVSVRGKNDHHKVEAVFKALAKALKKAVYVEGQDIPSAKGTL